MYLPVGSAAQCVLGVLLQATCVVQPCDAIDLLAGLFSLPDTPSWTLFSGQTENVFSENPQCAVLFTYFMVARIIHIGVGAVVVTA